MMSLTYLLAGIFAAYRLACMLAVEEGPFGLAEAYRNLFLKQDWLGRGVRCVLCTSFWTGLFVALSMFGLTPDLLWQWLAIAGGAYALARYLGLG